MLVTVCVSLIGWHFVDEAFLAGALLVAVVFGFCHVVFTIAAIV